MPVTATYRLQMHHEFTFADAARRVPYLAALGVSHLYLSPILKAVPGSQHGYDVVDHNEINPELGGRAGFEALASVAHEHGLGIVVDVVPNHMALVAPESANRPLWAVLKEGRDAPTAHWFDIDWKSGGGRIGLPILGDTLVETLQAGEITFDELADGEPVLRYHEHVFPIAVGTEAPTVEAVLARQHYQLASWRQKESMLNYRRFFDVDGLIAVRVEEDDVFDATHALLLELNHAGLIDGFRIDHPDGLADPVGYLQQLRASSREGTIIWVEKILEGHERLPNDWACDGTTGYDAMNAIQTALVDPAAEPELTAQWEASGGRIDVERSVTLAKRQVVEELLQPEVERLVRRAREALPTLDPARLQAAVVELLVAGEVYRAYVQPEQRLSPLARRRLRDAYEGAVAARPDLEPELARLIELATAEDADLSAIDFAVRLQQTWGPVMAKGIEDTTFYRWHRLIALNEVGGDPGALEHASAAALHDWALHQRRYWPQGMTTLSTHDTKRSEDTRAFLLAIAGDPATWKELSMRFRLAASQLGIDKPTAHLIWQTIAGAGLLEKERLNEYLLKAIREAKQHTAWVDGDPDYEQSVLDFADKALESGDRHEALVQAWDTHREAIRATVLGAKLLQLTAPGVPDNYQGCETLNQTLVDPDNRQPVDYDDLATRLEAIDAGDPVTDLSDEKLLVTSAAMRLRRERPHAFGVAGLYVPLTSSSEHALGFLRAGQVATIVTRAPHRLEASGGWKDSDVVLLPTGTWRDRLTNKQIQVPPTGEVPVRDLLDQRPVALLARDGWGKE
ncbi:malto-oligosyltrehalose synthase [Arsenicicoccus piscis]|uniref:Malto-oligosyltrehalose synthase n=1 Tax=Arsenicicoccus piscis TaxID=673954 RepID=A0ABQ6HSI6_9MICO|nr:malto-oligosyltrehalose synthase [Arsenicicoccus piscis]MCH8626217.1 malto-oligosyltrehalose synthase [Arsenicicoccus piscis]GMA20808.1 malto-oligosyltrehalose synthase [Arsenicicoccus piscis]